MGRIVIPKEMRRTLKIKEGDPVDIYFKEGAICIEPFKIECVMCGDTEHRLISRNGVLICEDCIKYLAAYLPEDKEGD